MVYINTDTAADVRGIVTDQLNRAANSLSSDIAAHKNGNTAIVPKSQIRRKAIEIAGRVAVYSAVFHYGATEGYDRALLEKVAKARSDAAALYGKDQI